MARVSKSVQEIKGILQPDTLSDYIVNRYDEWTSANRKWKELHKELRSYIFQTDTTQTTNAKLPWKNKTSIPKLCQIRDNLHANYMAALFPHDDWFKWEAAADEADTREAALMIEAYMKQKIRESGFKQTISDLLYDYIDAGNAFAEVSYVNEYTDLPDGRIITTYKGPRVYRISPYDIVFDLTAPTFADSAKITRQVVSIGALVDASESLPGFEWVKGCLPEIINVRKGLSAYNNSDIDKSTGVEIEGFGALSRYYSSDMVELLTFEGNLFNPDSGTLLKNHRIVVVDRRKVVFNEPTSSWLGRSSKEHVGWRTRPDNLWAMGPLDNLVGLQYRIDHLENLKADVFDQIAHPIQKIRGLVEKYTFGPGAEIHCDLEGDVEFMRPDTTALNADFQIDRYMEVMEEMAGAPRQAMGIRTPGEKTAFEVSTLENAAGRIFQQKIINFEERFIEPLLNQMLAQARQNLDGVEVVKAIDDDYAVSEFLKIGPEHLNAKGKLYPIGARHFAKQAQLTQNLSGLVNSGAYMDPGVQAHISGLKIAKLYEDNLGLRKHELVVPNIRVAEQMETQQAAATAQQGVAETMQNAAISADMDAAQAEEGLAMLQEAGVG